MHNPQLAAALRARSPGAFPDLLDTYGDRLFNYCWHLLRNRKNAQIAVRDALVVAAVQIRRLVYDEWLGLWLYSLARVECLRYEAVPAPDADEPVVLEVENAPAADLDGTVPFYATHHDGGCKPGILKFSPPDQARHLARRRRGREA